MVPSGHTSSRETISPLSQLWHVSYFDDKRHSLPLFPAFCHGKVAASDRSQRVSHPHCTISYGRSDTLLQSLVSGHSTWSHRENSDSQLEKLQIEGKASLNHIQVPEPTALGPVDLDIRIGWDNLTHIPGTIFIWYSQQYGRSLYQVYCLVLYLIFDQSYSTWMRISREPVMIILSITHGSCHRTDVFCCYSLCCSPSRLTSIP